MITTENILNYILSLSFTTIMIIITLLQYKTENKLIIAGIFCLSIIFHYISPFKIYKNTLESTLTYRSYVLSHKIFLFLLGGRCAWVYRNLIEYEFYKESFILAFCVMATMDLFRSYVYSNLEVSLYSELYKSYNVKLLMFSAIVFRHKSLYIKDEKKRFFTQLKKFRKNKPKEIDCKGLWNRWSDSDSNMNFENKYQNTKILPFTKKEKEFINLNSLQRYADVHGNFIHSFLSHKSNAEIDYQRFSEDIRQLNQEREAFYKNLKSQDRLKSMIHSILVILEICLFIFCFGSIMKISISFITLSAPFFIVSIAPAIVSRLGFFFGIIFSHGFDCGDRVYIDDMNLIVKSIYLFSIEMTMWNGTNVVVPSSLINSEPIGNARRSGPQKGILKLIIENKPKKLNLLLEKIREKSKENEFIKEIDFKIIGIEKCKNIKLKIIFTHYKNFQNGFFMWRRHNSFFRDVKKILDKEKVVYVPNDLNFEILYDRKKQA